MVNSGLAITASIACGLAFDIERDSRRKSGFRPAETDLGSNRALFAELRLEGFAAALATGFAEKLIIAGGDESRYKSETVTIDGEERPINRAWAIREMLIHDCGIDPSRVEAFSSRSNTGGNIAIFRSVIEGGHIGPSHCGLVTNHYHLPRASMDLVVNDLRMPLFAAEALILVGRPDCKDLIVHNLGGGPLAERIGEELAGIADKIRGTYAPRTDVAPT